MKRLIAMAALGVLAACGNPAEEADDPIVRDAPVATADAMDGVAGTYEIVMADGTIVTQTLRADGTYSDVANGEVTETGTWRAAGDSMCYDPEGDAAEECYAGGEPGPDGAFEVRDGDGNISATVRRIGDENMVTEPTA